MSVVSSPDLICLLCKRWKTETEEAQHRAVVDAGNQMDEIRSVIVLFLQNYHLQFRIYGSQHDQATRCCPIRDRLVGEELHVLCVAEVRSVFVVDG